MKGQKSDNHQNYCEDIFCRFPYPYVNCMVVLLKFVRSLRRKYFSTSFSSSTSAGAGARGPMALLEEKNVRSSKLSQAKEGSL